MYCDDSLHDIVHVQLYNCMHVHIFRLGSFVMEAKRFVVNHNSVVHEIILSIILVITYTVDAHNNYYMYMYM